LLTCECVDLSDLLAQKLETTCKRTLVSLTVLFGGGNLACDGGQLTSRLLGFNALLIKTYEKEHIYLLGYPWFSNSFGFREQRHSGMA
jgi:hypothetical protein